MDPRQALRYSALSASSAHDPREERSIRMPNRSLLLKFKCIFSASRRLGGDSSLISAPSPLNLLDRYVHKYIH
jgi:hypothetical protein